jgi:hypothetical protein
VGRDQEGRSLRSGNLPFLPAFVPLCRVATLTLTEPNAVDVDSLAFSRDGRALAAVDGVGNAFVCPVS